MEGGNQQFRLEINITSQQQVIGDITLAKGPYALVSYEGGLTMSGLTLNGSFDFLVTSDGLAVNTASTLSLSVGTVQLLGFSLNGGFAITNAGFSGAIALNLVYNNPTPFGFSNPNPTGFMLSINTTGETQSTGSITLPEGNYVEVVLTTGRIGVTDYNLSYGIILSGDFRFRVSDQGVTLSASGTTELIVGNQPLMGFNVQGDLEITSEGLAGVLSLERTFDQLDNYGLTLASGSSQFRLEINRGTIPRSIGLNQLPAGPYARVVTEGSLEVQGMLLEGTFAFEIGSSGLEIEVDGRLDFNVLNQPLMKFKVQGGLNLSQAGIVAALELQIQSSLTENFNFNFTAQEQTGFSFIGRGGSMSFGNLALQGTAFAKDELLGGALSIHRAVNINDGRYGNDFSWIGDSANSFVGVNLGGSHFIDRIAFGRDNTAVIQDSRTAGWYRIQYTNEPNPSAATADEHWSTLGEVRRLNSPEDRLRHEYRFDPVQATAVRVVTVSIGSAIDELEIYESEARVDGFKLNQIGGTMPSGNIALNGTPFAKDELLGGALSIHRTVNINDGRYGNDFSWIGDSANSFVGVKFNGNRVIDQIAFGRDNTDMIADTRALGRYLIQYTQDSNPGVDTQDSQWITLGEVNRLNGPESKLRHEYRFDPVQATAVRIVTIESGLAIDEIEVYLSDPVNVGFQLNQMSGSMPDDNIALSGRAFGKDELAGGAYDIHRIVNINDGLYGNDHSWIGDTANSFIGIDFRGSKMVDGIAFGRDNTGLAVDGRTNGHYRIQYTRALNPGSHTPDSEWITIGEVTRLDQTQVLRHEYRFDPVQATAIRLVTLTHGLAVDELEVYGEQSPNLTLVLEINTTSQTQTVGGVVLEAGSYARIKLQGIASIGGFNFSGLFTMKAADYGLEVGIDATVGIFNMQTSYRGTAGIYTDGIAFQGTLSGQNLVIAGVTIRGQFGIGVNLTPRSISGMDPYSVRLNVTNASVTLLGSTLSGSLTIDITNQNVSIVIPEKSPLTLRVLDNFEVKLHGHIRPNDFNLNGTVAVSFGDKASIHFGGALEVKVSNSGITASANMGLTIWNVYVAHTSVNIEINAKRLTFDVNTAFQIHQFARYVGVLNVTIENGFVSVTANSTVRLWNTFDVSVKGSINSKGQYSFVGTTWLSIGNSNFGGDFTFRLMFSSDPVVLDIFGQTIVLAENTISMVVSGTARAGSTVNGKFVGATANFSAHVDHEGRFSAYVEASIEIPILKGVYFWAYPPWEWLDLHHYAKISAGITVNFQLANGIRIWASELGDSEIYFTSNLDGTPDELGSGGQADGNGNANFNLDWEDLDVDELEALFFQVLDKNGDGRLDSDVGQIKVIGGYHWLTDEDNPGIEVLTERWLYSDSDWAEATVFIDRNQNDEIDEGELSVIADDEGFYDFWELIFGEEDEGDFELGLLEPYDLNGDGVIDETEGVLVLTGGVDYFTGEPNAEIEVFDFVEVFYESDWVGATVFLDTNGNLELDDFEVVVETDDFGFWDFSMFDDEFEEDPYWELLDLIVYDLNEDGVISPDEGQIVVRGGFDLFSGEAFNSSFIMDETLGYGFLDYAEAEVFFDIDLDGEYDEDEPLVYSDDTGYYEFYTLSAEELLEDLVVYDLNGDGVITPDEGVLYVVGGKHWLTEEANEQTVRLDEALGYGETDFAGARVFLDLNANATFDPDEPVALTDDYGFYWFYTPTLEEAELWLGALVKYDTNRDGILSEEEGSLLLIGGTNLNTGAYNDQTVVIESPNMFDFTDYADATVFFDQNKNGIHDEEELLTKTDSDGYYEFVSYSEEDLQFHIGRLVPFDTNGNAELDPEEGQFVVVGGTHILTGVVNEGSVVDENIGLSGYSSYSGATHIYFDANKNLQLDDGEISVTPDQNNFYTFFDFDTDQFNVDNLGNLARYDANHNGTLDPDEGIFVINGGMDQHTGLENTLFIRALGSDFGSGLVASVSPLSNLKVSMVNWWGIQPAEADRIIAAGFGLPDYLNMNVVNPLSDQIKDPVSQRVLSVGAILTSMTLDMASVLQAANPSLTVLEAQVAVADSIADAIIFKLLDKLEGVNGLENLSLDDDGYYYGLFEGLGLKPEDYIYNSDFQVVGMPALLNVINPAEFIAILEDAAYWTDTDLTQEQVETTANVIVEKNKRIQALAQNDLSKPLETLASFKALSQGATSEVLADYILNGGDPAAILAQFSGTALLSRLAEFAPENLAPYLQSIDNQYTAPGKTIHVPFNTWDLNQSVSDLEFSFDSSNESVVSNSSISVMGEGENKVLEFRVGNALTGHTELTVKVSDGELTTEHTLRVEILPHVVKWESIAEHGNGLGEVGLEIEEAGVFSEARLGGIQILDVTFNEPVDPNTVTGEHLYFVGISQETQQLMDLAHIDMEVTMLDGNSKARIVFSEPIPDHARFRIGFHRVETSQGFKLDIGTNRLITNLPGDANGDLKVNNLDLGGVRSLPEHHQIDVSSIHEIRSDFNIDGRVDAADIELLYHWRGQNTQFIPSPSAPEMDPVLFNAVTTGALALSSYLNAAFDTAAGPFAKSSSEGIDRVGWPLQQPASHFYWPNQQEPSAGTTFAEELTLNPWSASTLSAL